MKEQVKERFFRKVAKRTNGCWEWIGQIQNMGYGQFYFDGRSVSAHRFSYELVNGAIPPDKEIDHLCRNRSCVNPEHLEVITHAENGRRGIAGLHTAIENWSKTHCPHGHPYDTFNTYYWHGQRKCRICSRESLRRWRKKNVAVK